MDFLNSAFFWAMPLASVPVIIHLLNRQRRKVIHWGAMQFLLEAASRRRRLWRLSDLMLMLLRLAAITLIVLALTQPLVRWAGLGESRPRDVILVLDSSMSMGRKTADGTLFDE